jgi:hypothetical protein
MILNSTIPRIEVKLRAHVKLRAVGAGTPQDVLNLSGISTAL